MSIKPMDLRFYTVPQLREKAKEIAPLSTGFSKMRKAELIDFIVRTSEAVVEQAEELVSQDDIEANVSDALPVATITVPTVGTFEANEFLAFVGSRLAADFTPQDRRDLDMAKYRGRYEGKSVAMPDGRFGKVTGGTHRDSDPTGRSGGTLLLSVKHDVTRYGHPRVTLHRAEDVVLV